MKLTLKALVELNACSEAMTWFSETFPDGGEVTETSLALFPRDEWVCGLACKLSRPYRFWCAGISFREAPKVNPSLQKYVMNVTEENWREAKHAANAANARDRIYTELRAEAVKVLCAM